MKHQTVYTILSALLGLLLCFGCADDVRTGGMLTGEVGEAVIHFSVENISLTRTTDGSLMESAVDHAYLLFYPSDASTLNSEPVAYVRAEVSSEIPGSLSFRMPHELESATDYRLLALANADNYTPEGFGSFSDYLQSRIGLTNGDGVELMLHHADRISVEKEDFLPMLGKIEGDSMFRFSNNKGTYSVNSSISFRRMVSRIDVANIVKEGFVVEGVALCNWRDAVSVENLEGNRSGSVRGAMSEGGDFSDGILFSDMPDRDASGIQQLKENLYCFPSVCYDSTTADTESTAIIIKARYGEDAQSSYYRVNVGVKGNRAEVKANTKYLVTIQSVKGRGAATPEEAYTSKESMIELSVVEDWDLEGSFAMDDNGNFIVLSTGSLEFAGEAVESREVRILTSKGSTWTVEYSAVNDASGAAFSHSVLSNQSLVVSTNGINESANKFSGKFRVTSNTPDGGSLTVDVAVVQNIAGGQSEEPVIPEGMPFALVSEDKERVRIDHEKMRIEIDGFDPGCFNSFIDVPFRVYLAPGENIESVTVSSTLMWPLEGRVATEGSAQFLYCMESFSASGTGSVEDSQGNPYGHSALYKESLTIGKEIEFYISVGAMGPDDPAIIRELILTASNNSNLSYTMIIKPRKIIIDDIIFTDSSGDLWIVADRNIQATSSDYVGRDSSGNRWQAYNYSNKTEVAIPFKYKSENTPIFETQHTLYQGVLCKYYNRKGTSRSISNYRSSWLERQAKGLKEDMPAPIFYDISNKATWVFPYLSLIEEICKNMCMSKMRMFLTSDYPAKEGDLTVPICCYWPLMGIGGDPDSGTRNGYYISMKGNDLTIAETAVYIRYHESKVRLFNWINDGTGIFADDDQCVGRLVRSLTKEELEEYKKNYLGYGESEHRMTICHPDTYESTGLGWIAN